MTNEHDEKNEWMDFETYLECKKYLEMMNEPVKSGEIKPFFCPFEPIEFYF